MRTKNIFEVTKQFRDYLAKDEEMLIAAKLEELLRDYMAAVERIDSHEDILGKVKVLCRQSISLLEQDVYLHQPDVKPILKITETIPGNYLVHEQFVMALHTINMLNSSPLPLEEAKRLLVTHETAINNYLRLNNPYLWEKAIEVLVRRLRTRIQRQIDPYMDSLGESVSLERVRNTAKLAPFEEITNVNGNGIELAAFISSDESLNIRELLDETSPHYPVLYRLEIECQVFQDEEDSNLPSFVVPQANQIGVVLRVNPRYYTPRNDVALWEPLDDLSQRVVVIEIQPITTALSSKRLVIQNPFSAIARKSEYDFARVWQVNVHAVLMTELGSLPTNEQSFLLRSPHN